KNDLFIQTLKTGFDDIEYCMRQMSAWMDDLARIKCNRFLRSQNALIPILDYMMLSGNRDVPDGENGKAMTQYIYMSFFRRLFSRASDSVLDRIHTIMSEAVKQNPRHFPIETLRDFMIERQNTPYRLEDYYLSTDSDLILNI